MKGIYIILPIVIAGFFSCDKVDRTTADTDERFFYPGKVWYDTDSVPIEAHACGILKVKDTYYMYGQDQRLGHNNRTGICCYSSTNLHDWKYEGTVLPTIATPEVYRDSGTNERPKVIYNAKTNKYVMWMHLDGDSYARSEAGVAVSDSPTGPFTFVKSFRPIHYDYGYNRMDGGKEVVTEENHMRIKKLKEKENGNTFRDMSLLADDDGSAYVFYSSENNSTLYIVKLSDDYLDIARPAIEGKTWSRALIDQKREAPAPFKHKGKYLMITSGLTGWNPNPAQYHTADNILGPWTSHGNPCVGPGAEITFGAQSTFVLPAPGKSQGSFIFMADIWDSEHLEKSTLFWQPFVVSDDFTFTIRNFEKWSMDIFDNPDKNLLQNE